MRVSRRGLLCAGVAVLGLVLAAPAIAQPDRRGDGGTRSLWGALTSAEARSELRGASIRPERFRGFELAEGGMELALADDALVLSLPHPDGGFERFRVEETSVLAPGLAARHPRIRTFTGTGIDDPGASVAAGISPSGFHASVRSAGGWWYVDPSHHRGNAGIYVSYYGRDLENVRAPLVEHEQIEELAHEVEAAAGVEDAEGPAVTRRVYRLALVSDPTYAAYHGAENVTAAKALLVSRVNQIYETESAIRLVLAAGNDALNLNTAALATGQNGPCGAEPCYFPDELEQCNGGTLHWTRIVIGQILGASSYDVGHIVLGTEGGGIAGLGVVGRSLKASGCTGLEKPVGDYFAVDYVAHELGHQFGAHHTFNGVNGNCAGSNRSAANSVEPGSGSSIMAYAGICDNDNLQPHTDPYWSQRSRDQIAATVGAGTSSIGEVQTVSLRNFGGTDSFKLRYNGQTSKPIQRGSNYTAAGIRNAIHGISGFPTTVTVAPFGGLGSGLTDVGFQVTFAGAVDRLPLQVVNAVGATGFVGETDKGGATTHRGAHEATGNAAPDVSAPASFTIPLRTPFALTATGSDPNGDTLTYLWEQNDAGAAQGTGLRSNDKKNGPLFRVFGTPLQKPPYVETEYNNVAGVNAPTTDPTRVFPDLPQILAGNTNASTGSCPAGNIECFSEFLPTGAYQPSALTFRVTARDGRPGGGGIATATTTLTLAKGAGPFRVTSHTSGAAFTGGDETNVTWAVNGTNAPALAPAVRISLSVDGGLTYPYELAGSTANDGTEVVRLPDVEAAQARIRVAAVGNVFFAVNEASFPILENPGPPATTILSGPPPFTNEREVLFTFTSREGATFKCSLDGSPFTPCTSPYVTDTLADGEHLFRVRAKDGGGEDPTPAERAFVVDTEAPGPPGISGPSGKTGLLRPTFTFTSEAGATFTCSLDGAGFSACASPHRTAALQPGPHVLVVRATDRAGNTGGEASRSFTYVPPPNTTIVKRTIRHAARTATFRFTGSGGIGARTFQCRLTGTQTTARQRTWTTCASPRTYRRLRPALYTFEVRARDATGRVDPTPAKSAFRVRRA